MSLSTDISLERLWQEADFTPNKSQETAIRHVDGPLYITAGPGSGKTRVLLWRVVNLIVLHGIKPQEIYLSTFTEKAATQLVEGLRLLLGMVSNLNGKPYDISKMYVGTVHSSCHKILTDRRFTLLGQRPKPPSLMEELQQYLFVYDKSNWEALTKASGFGQGANRKINALFTTGQGSMSRHNAVRNCIGFFGRLAEECISPRQALRKVRTREQKKLIHMYNAYLELCKENERTDLSHMQTDALRVLSGIKDSGSVFKHVIIDEYQDTNTVQEKLFFALAAGSKNLCVVGDDDQALYRFRGATVENFVQFPERCKKYLGSTPKQVSLSINYRSCKGIVDFYGRFIESNHCDWKVGPRTTKQYRVPKQIKAKRSEANLAVVATKPGTTESVCAEIAALVARLIREKKVADPNQIAFLYPSLGPEKVQNMIAALEKKGLEVYAPRAGNFLDVEESQAFFGVLCHLFGKPENSGDFGGRDLEAFYEWIENAHDFARNLIQQDSKLAHYLKERKTQIAQASKDFRVLSQRIVEQGWEAKEAYVPENMRDILARTSGLGLKAKAGISSPYFDGIIRRRNERGQQPHTLRYVVNRFCSLDWTVLDLLYQLSGFKYFKSIFDKAEIGDEGPICNLSLISQYLDKYQENFGSIITGEQLEKEYFARSFFRQYLYTLHRRGEGEYESEEVLFPKGRIPFLTIHQAKGLEFPVVVLGNPQKKNFPPGVVEQMIAPMLKGKREPLDRMSTFDKMRMFYVALSRPMNLLVLAHYDSKNNHVGEPFRTLLKDEFPRTSELDWEAIPASGESINDLPKSYSYTGDYLYYQRCPRNYMVFQHYGFAPSRSQTMFFGSLIHQTIEDLHEFLIAHRGQR